MRVLCVGKNAHSIRGKKTHNMHWQTHSGKAHVNECSFYAWEKLRIIYVEKATHIMHEQTHRGNTQGRNAHFMQGKKMRGKKRWKNHAYYTLANPRWKCPR